MKITKQIIENIYAGWLGKVIGVRLGSPIEGMWYHGINEKYGEITDYLFDYDLYAADDDTNGPLFFLRGLEDGGHGKRMTAQDVGHALLDYAPYEHGFFWWGGYGISTEHTAYLNLRAGVKAGASGSIALNGATVAEQIGGQIFIDTWGLVCPGNPDLAARLAKKAASVTHDGNGVWGGIFVAVCVSLAFVEKDINKIIERALAYIPYECEYARVTRAVRDFYKAHPDNWRECYMFVRENFGYDKYPGNCHIIPNAAVVVLSLLYGAGDYSKSICISCMCGWDTDCNAGNVGAIMGTLVGIDGIEEKWIKPINDLIVCSSVIGRYNISDIPEGALYIAKLASSLCGDELPEPYRALSAEENICHFELPRSTHAINVIRSRDGVFSFEKKRYAEGEEKPAPNFSITNTNETANSGARSLKITSPAAIPGEKVLAVKYTYYHPSDFSDSRYDPEFSPVAYPGQTVRAAAYVPHGSATACVFCYDERHDKMIYGKKATLKAGRWQTLELEIPRIEAGLIRCVGVCFEAGQNGDFVCFVDDISISGNASYTVDFSKEKSERWHWKHIDVSQFTRVKGIFRLDGGASHLSGPDFAEVYTGDVLWRDYEYDVSLEAVSGREHYVNVRVEGAMRSYAVGFDGDEFCIVKNNYGRKKLASVKHKLELGRQYRVGVAVKGDTITATLDGELMLAYTDKKPLLFGSVGLSNRNGSHTKYTLIDIK